MAGDWEGHVAAVRKALWTAERLDVKLAAADAIAEELGREILISMGVRRGQPGLLAAGEIRGALAGLRAIARDLRRDVEEYGRGLQ